MPACLVTFCCNYINLHVHVSICYPLINMYWHNKFCFRDTPLSREEHDQVVNKLCLYLEKLTPQEIPAFAYQILRLCKNTSVRLFFLRLQNYFGLRIYDQHRDSDSDLSEMVDGIGQLKIKTIFRYKT